MTGRVKRVIVGAALSLSALALVPAVASAHPLGNFTVNQYSGIVVRSDGVDVNYVLDMAEIPTAQLLSQLDSDEGRLLTAAAADAYGQSECVSLESALSVRVGGTAAALTVEHSTLTFPTGAAGLHTLRLACGFRTSPGTAPIGQPVTFANHNYDDRVGWREITATGTSATLAGSDVPRTSVSSELTTYPTDLLTSPLDQRTAALTVVAGTGGGAQGTAPGASSSVLSRGVDQFGTAFAALVAHQDMNALFVLLALGLALALGGIHAFAPGHGKTLMAAYLVGQRGSLRHAAALAGSVTITHTIGVLALGVALSVSTSFAPTQVYPWLGLVSGLIVVTIGVSLLRRALRSRAAHAGTDHGPASSADVSVVEAASHRHGGRRHTHAPTGAPAPRLRSVLAIGFAGGLVPSPSALVVLIGGIALHRTWFAVLLVLVYGTGMALVLTGAGVALRHARALLDRRVASRGPVRGGVLLSRVAAAVPVLTASAVILVGVGLTVRGGGGL